MKILYAVQGTGNGHLSRARAIVPELEKYGDTDVLISGHQVDVDGNFPVKYRLRGISFIFGKTGGVSVAATIRQLRPLQFLKDILTLPVRKYDIVISDFEPVSAWACKINRVKCYALSHQSAVLHPLAPKPAETDRLGRIILKYYAPATDAVGFHFEACSGQIFPPVIRDEVQRLNPSEYGHYTVYLPAYSDRHLLDFFSSFQHTRWEIFSKHAKQLLQQDNITLYPIDNKAFLKSLESCSGALMGAGFEGPAEALYLKKKLLVSPMSGQYEQHCNAAALKSLGVPAINCLDTSGKAAVAKWLEQGRIIPVNYPDDIAARAVAKLMERAFSPRTIAFTPTVN